MIERTRIHPSLILFFSLPFSLLVGRVRSFGATTIGLVISCIVLAFVLLDLIRSRTVKLKNQAIPFFLLLMVITFNAVIRNGYDIVFRIYSVLCILLPCISLLFDYTDRDIKLITRAMMMFGDTVLILCLFFGRAKQNSDRFGLVLFGIETDCNFMLQMLVVYYCIAVCCLCVAKKKSVRVLSLIRVVSVVVITLFSGSRASLIAFAAISIVIFCFETMSFVNVSYLENKKKQRNFKRGMVLIVLIICIAVFLIDFLPSNVYNRLFAENYMTQSDSYARLLSWERAINVIRKEPLFGYGMIDYATMSLNKFGVEIDTHNTFLMLAFSYGLVGLFIFLYIIFTVSKKCVKNRQYTIFAMVIGLVITAFFITSDKKIFYWVELMYCVTLINHVAKNKISIAKALDI